MTRVPQTKKILLYSLVVIAAALILSQLTPLSLYGTDGYYFFGLSKYLLAGDLQNSYFFSFAYPAFFAVLLTPFQVLNLSYEATSYIFLALYLISGPLIFHFIYKKNPWHLSLFFFFFSMSGFFVVEVLVGKILLPQALGFLLLPIFPALLFSKEKNASSKATALLILIYLIHSATAFFILLSTALSFVFKPLRKKVWPFAAFLLPVLLIKGLHFILLQFNVPFESLPLFDFLHSIGFSTADRELTQVYSELPLKDIILSGVPFALFLPPLIFFKKKENPVPMAAYWFSALFIVTLFTLIFYQSWSELVPIGWTRSRYLGFSWLALALMLPLTFSTQTPKFKKIFSALALIFIIFQFTMAIQREAQVDTYVEDQIAWITNLQEEVPNGNVFFMSAKNFGTYAYGILSPRSIYFHFPSQQGHYNIEGTQNKRTPFPTFHGEPSKANAESFFSEANISLIVVHNEFWEPFTFLEESPAYKELTPFQGELKAYEKL